MIGGDLLASSWIPSRHHTMGFHNGEDLGYPPYRNIEEISIYGVKSRRMFGYFPHATSTAATV